MARSRIFSFMSGIFSDEPVDWRSTRNDAGAPPYRLSVLSSFVLGIGITLVVIAAVVATVLATTVGA